MHILIGGKLVNFLQYGSIQAAMTLKSSPWLCAQIQLSSENI